MSYKSWEDEYYPKPASEATSTELEAARHSLKKWQGATGENTSKHGVTFHGLGIWDGTVSRTPFGFGNHTCALCQYNESESGCGRCVLLKLGAGCTLQHSPYEKAAEGDVIPMIKALEQAVSILENKSSLV